MRIFLWIFWFVCISTNRQCYYAAYFTVFIIAVSQELKEEILKTVYSYSNWHEQMLIIFRNMYIDKIPITYFKNLQINPQPLHGVIGSAVQILDLLTFFAYNYQLIKYVPSFKLLNCVKDAKLQILTAFKLIRTFTWVLGFVCLSPNRWSK